MAAAAEQGHIFVLETVDPGGQSLGSMAQDVRVRQLPILRRFALPVASPLSTAAAGGAGAAAAASAEVPPILKHHCDAADIEVACAAAWRRRRAAVLCWLTERM